MGKKPNPDLLNSAIHLTKKATGVIVELYNHMIRRLILVSLWLVLTPSLVIVLGILLTLQKNKLSKLQTISTPLQANIAQAGPNNIQGQVLGTQITDTRPLIVEKFLKGTPLAPYSKYMVEISDKYDIDYRLIPAIAMKESGGGAASQTSHNAWGFENGRTKFSSWETGIESVALTLKTRYISKGLVTPDQIMAIYAPPQLETGGKWARDINYFFTKMETL